MRRHLLDLVILLGLSTIACVYLAIAQPGIRSVAIYSYVLIVGALVMLAIVSSFGDAFPRHRRSPFDEALVETIHRDRTPAQVEQVERAVTLGVATDLVRGDIYFWGELMAGALITAVPVAVAYNFFLDRFIAGITGGAVK